MILTITLGVNQQEQGQRHTLSTPARHPHPDLRLHICEVSVPGLRSLSLLLGTPGWVKTQQEEGGGLYFVRDSASRSP